jgi:putative nucleotidyltransferase with HDIG domain
MWPFRKPTRYRRLEAMKAPAGGGSRWSRFCRAGGIMGCLYALALFAAVAVLDLWPVDPFPYRLGQYLPQDVHARVRFRMVLNNLMDNAKGRALRATPAVFVLDEPVVQEIGVELKLLPEQKAPPSTQPAAADQAAPWRALAADPNAVKAYNVQVAKLVEELPAARIVRMKDPHDHKPALPWPQTVLLRNGEKELAKDRDEVVNIADKNALVGEVARLSGVFPQPLRKNVEAYLLKKFTEHPLYRYDPEATQEAMDKVVAAIEANPPDEAYRMYAVGDRIAQGSMRPAPPASPASKAPPVPGPRPAPQAAPAGPQVAVPLSAQDLEVLRKEHEFFCAEQAAHPLEYWTRILSQAAILLLTVALLAFYVAHYQPELVRRPSPALAYLVLLAAMLALSKVLVEGLRLNPYVTVLPVMMAATIVAIAHTQRFALAVGAIMSMLVVLQVRGSMEMFLVLLGGSCTAVFQLNDVRTRTRLIRVAAVCAAVVVAGVWVTELAQAVPSFFAFTDAVYAASCALFMGFLVQGFLPLVEHVFRVATSLTLLEWCDASKPLLKRLAMEAPGTYNHSLQLGALCEAAAESVGARGLLARVGAYYHDIGKINKPDYFMENQPGTQHSRHSKLSPAMSLLIIIGHVKDGLELAREYGLPKVLYEFIVTHHGTTLVQYFYHAATEQRRGESDRPPEEVEFRYPGPKPRLKEPAILMLADAAESSVRAMSEPTPGRIENQVHTMISRRLMDGQLDDCDLTLKEVHLIETSLVKSLCSMYHARLAYPTPPGQRPSAGEALAARSAANGSSAPKSDSADGGSSRQEA